MQNIFRLKYHVILALVACSVVVAWAMPSCDSFISNPKAFGRRSPLLEKAIIYYPFFQSITKFDPHIIHLAGAAVLGQNLYSRLLTLDDDGQISGDLADDVQWNGRSYVFHIRDDARTIDGYKIGPKDVVVSLKRILKVNKNTHGSLAPFLAEKDIEQDDQHVILTPKDPGAKVFLLDTLATIDFSIIPAVALDMSKEGWPVVDWRNTSGLYYVEKDSEDGALTLKINPHHHFFNKTQTKILQLYPGKGDDAIEAFNKGLVDIIPTVNTVSKSLFKNLKGDLNVFKSQPIHVTSVKVTQKGLSRLTIKQRIKVGLVIRDAYLAAVPPEEGISTHEFFPKFSEGSLTSDQKAELVKVLEAASKEELPAKVTFAVYPSKLDFFQKILQGFPEIEVVSTRGIPSWLEPESRQPDFYFSGTDAGFYESLSLLYYNIDQGSFMDPHDGEQWLDVYIHKQNKGERISMLKKLHLDFLEQGRVIPILAASYISVTRRPLLPNYSKFYAGNPLWKMTTN